MHMQGNPQTMQNEIHYTDVVRDVSDYLAQRIDVCMRAGIDKARLIIDPGIGFGKTVEHNIQLLKNLAVFAKLGVPVLVGASRKSFIAGVAPPCTAEQRLGGSIAAALLAARSGAAILRVHDVFETRQALCIERAIAN
jgi:dihydropteroate synthase